MRSTNRVLVSVAGRRVPSKGLSLLIFLTFVVDVSLAYQNSFFSQGEPAIRLEKDSRGNEIFKVVGWPGSLDPQAQAANLTTSDWQEILAIYVDTGSGEASEIPPILGTYRIEGSELIFRPRFPLEPGLAYRAVFSSDGAADVTSSQTRLTASFLVPKPDIAPSTRLQQVFPSIDVLPENQLKLYLHFSAPMSRGKAYHWIRLLDEADQPIVLPFLELDEELWDREGKRLTLLFDPGRIKRGVRPLEEVGPAIEAGKRYTLEIDPSWRDAEGRPLIEGHEKSFSVSAADRESPGIQAWKLAPPEAGNTDPLVVELPEPMDRALLLRTLEVVDSRGNRIAGSIRVDRQETRWQFTPQRPWTAGDYLLEIETTLEDLAGNRVNRLFEVDVFEQVEAQVSRETLTLPFEVR